MIMADGNKLIKHPQKASAAVIGCKISRRSGIKLMMCMRLGITDEAKLQYVITKIGHSTKAI